MVKVWILTIMFVTNHQVGYEVSHTSGSQVQTYVNISQRDCESMKAWWLKKHPKKVLMAECTLQVMPK